MAKQQVALLLNRITEKEIQIKALTDKDSVTVNSYNRELSLMKDQLTSTQRALRREKRKRFFTGAAGVLTTGITTFLLLKK